MLLPSARFDLPFTCVDATGLPTAPTGTPTAVLVQNGTDLGTTVTVTMTGAQGIASCTIPSSGVSAGDRFYIQVSAVVSAVTYVVAGPSEAIESPQTLTSAYDPAKTAAPTAATNASQVRTELATELARLDVAVGTRLATSGYTAPTTPPTAAANASQVRTELATELARLDVAVGTRLATSGYTAPTTPPTVAAIADEVRVELATELARIDAAVSSRLAAGSYTAPTVPPTASEVAAAILLNPSNKLATNGSGYVTATNGSSGDTNVIVMPMRSSVAGRVIPNRIELFIRETIELEIAVLDSRAQPVDCTGLTAELLVEDCDAVTGLTPTGSPPHKYAFDVTSEMTVGAGLKHWSLRVEDATEKVLALGVMSVEEAE